MSDGLYPSASPDLPPYKIHTILLPSPLPNNPPTPIATLLPPALSLSLSSPNTIPPHATPYPPYPSYTILGTPTKGFGMFAHRAIKAGEVILVEHPVLIVPERPLPPDTPAWDNLASDLPEREHAEMLTMANCRSRAECPNRVEGIVRTNAILLDLTPTNAKTTPSTRAHSQKFGGVFLKINRCNHSCGPNATHKWVLSNLSSTLYALRDIAIGEEITTFYTDVTQPRDTRRVELARNHRFRCTCPHCSPSSTTEEEAAAIIKQSDDIRDQLGHWLSTRPSYLKWSTDLCRADDTVISSHHLALSLIAKENMHFLQHIFIEELALSYAILGNDEKFEFWAKEFIQKCGVEDQERAKEFEGWLEDRRKCRKWAWREKQRKMG
jgi:hypothetical protein